MEINEAILAAGAEAVKTYLKISGCSQDNEAPERFLSSWMAVKLYEKLGLLAKVERQYTQISDGLGLKLDAEGRGKITGLSADIVLYDGTKPLSLVAVKKFDEDVRADDIRDDLHKGDPVGLSKELGIYAGVMVCEVAGQQLNARKAELERVTRSDWVYSLPVRSSRSSVALVFRLCSHRQLTLG